MKSPQLLWCFLLLALVINPISSQEEEEPESYLFTNALPIPNLNRCDRIKRNQPDEQCTLMELFNQTQVNLMDQEQFSQLSFVCACQLLQMGHLFTDTIRINQEFSRISSMITNMERAKQQLNYSVDDYSYWTNVDVIVKQVSIYTSLKDYFYQLHHNKSSRPSNVGRKLLDKNPMWLRVKSICRRVAEDPYKVYRYMENLCRLNAMAFFELLIFDPSAMMLYQSSKACKLLLNHNLNSYKLKPDNPKLIPVNQDSLLNRSQDEQSQNELWGDINEMLKSTSAHLLNCQHQQTNRSSFEQLNADCPMLMGPNLTQHWLGEKPTAEERAEKAASCSCQLLLHNSTWTQMMLDPNVKLMSLALINYLNRNQVPDFATTPIWSLFQWFNEIMQRFVANKKMSIKEIVKTKSGNQDPLKVINHETNDYSNALELMRRACNYIMFNYNKGSNATSELKLIKYLDNLRLLSRDPMFVFQVTLQDPNLFKIHALSKMCHPIVS